MITENNPSSPAEITKNFSKESLRPDAYNGLHARLLLADKDFFNPQKRIDTNKEKKVTSFEERDYGHFERASARERKKFWNDKTTDEKYTLWKETLISNVNKLSEKKRTEVFNPLFRQMGIKINNDTQEFTEDDAKKLHDHYFSDKDPHDPEKKKNPEYKGVKQFVRDVLKAHGGNVLDEDKLADIKKFAGIFGEASSDMIEQLIAAEVRLRKENTFVRQLPTERINTLHPEEMTVLKHIYDAREAERTEKKHALETKLPIMEYRDQIDKKLLSDDTILLIGGTGCGKTVGFPFMIRELMDKERAQGKDPGKFFITEPTVINTESLAAKIADDSAVTLGHEVDYQHSKREGKYNPDANTVLMTQMTLIQKFLHNDDEIRKMSRLMIDEAHALSTDTVLLMALAKKEQQRRRETGESPLAVYVASATIDEEKFKGHLGVTETLKIPGQKSKEISEKFLEEPIVQDTLPQEAAERVKGIMENQEDGDIMIFVAGKTDIESTIDEINKIMNEHELNKNKQYLSPIGLHSDSSPHEKDEATKIRTDGKRRIIVSTNFAETGITIPGLKHVIDTGLKKEMVFNPQTGLQKLETVKASQDECIQRRGRVGRIEPGKWYPLYTKDDFNGKTNDMTGQKRPIHIVPEIEQTDITNTILLLKSFKHDIRELDLLAKPTEKKLNTFEDTLLQLGALRKKEGSTFITPLGRDMNKLSREIDDIHFQRLVAEARIYQPRMLEQTCALVALVKEKSIFLSPKQQEKLTTEMQIQTPKELFKERGANLIDTTSDFKTLSNIWDAFQAVDPDKRYQWALDRGLNPDKLDYVRWQKDKLLKSARRSAPKVREGAPTTLEDMVSRAYADRIMKLNPKGSPELEKTYVWEKENPVNFTIEIDRDSFVKPEDAFEPYPHRIFAGDLRVKGSIAFLSNCQVAKLQTSEQLQS